MIGLWNRARHRSDPSPERYRELRRRMVTEQVRGRGMIDADIQHALASIPRHRFVPRSVRDNAYEDRALPIGFGQTISQPFMLALMTLALSPKRGMKVLEVGTGSGYQAAVLAFLGCSVWTVERLPALALRAQTTVTGLGVKTVRFRIGDGSTGWREASPFQAVLVTAGSPSVPESLKSQLDDGGRLVIPTGSWTVQTLLTVERRGNRFVESQGGACAFVPLLGEEGWST